MSASVDVADCLQESQMAVLASSVDAPGRLQKTLFGTGPLKCGHIPVMDGVEELSLRIQVAFGDSSVCFVTGDPGSGKSTRAPMAALKALETMGCGGRGAALLLQKKLGAQTLFDHIARWQPGVARLWNGEDKMDPKQQPFLMLTTPVSFYHCIKSADAWEDVGLLVLDEIHNKSGMMHLSWGLCFTSCRVETPVCGT